MKFRALLSASLLLALPAFAADGLPDKPEYRTFTAANGKEISAVVVDKTEKEVTFLLASGKRATVSLDKLSEEDQTYLKGWSKGKAIFLQKCRGLTVGQLLELRGYESFPFRLDNNSITVAGKINGVKASLKIDTGAGTTTLHDAFLKKAGCELGPYDHKIYGVSGEAPACWVTVPTITLGESSFKNRRLSATDMNLGLPEGTKRTDEGLLGADFLSQLDAVISYTERRIFLRPDLSDESTVENIEGSEEETEEALSFRLFKMKDGKTLRGKIKSKTATNTTLILSNGSKKTIFINNFVPNDAAYIFNWSESGALFLKHCRALTIEELLEMRNYQSFQYKRRGNHIFVDGTLNKQACTYMIDTGADSSLLHIDAAKAHGCEIGPMDQKVYGIGGFAPAAVTKIKELTMGDAVLTNRKVLSTDLDRFEQGLDWIGLFGADFMRELDAVITYKEDRIFLRQR
jgi:predicted aspartyl protease